MDMRLNKSFLVGWIIAIIVSFFAVPSFSIDSFATTVDTSKVTVMQDESLSGAQITNKQSKDDGTAIQTGDDILPTVTIDEAKNKITEKGFDIVELLQTIAKPFCIVMGIISLGVIALSIIYKNVFLKGFIGFILSAVVYTGVMYAPGIIQAIQTWLAS